MASQGPLLAALQGVADAAAFTSAPSDSTLLEFVSAHPTAGTAASLLQQHGALLRSLLNMGVRESRLQVDLYAAIRGDANTTAVLEKIRAILEAQSFLGGHTLSSTDVAVASALVDVLSLAFPPSLIPAEWQPIARWFSSVCCQPVVAAALRAARLATGGVVREGGQVDLRAEPAGVAALADASVAFNAGHKKAASQRDAEDAAKGAAAAGGATGGAAPAAAAGPAAGAASHAATSVAAPAAAASATQPASNKTLPEQSSEDRAALTHARLDAIGVAYTTTRHAAAVKLEDLMAVLSGLPGTPCKNLFIKAKKEKGPGDSRMWLVVAAHDTKVDLVALATKLGYGKIVLRFGDAESLLENLGVVQGNVSPFCLANDTALQVNVALDARILKPEAAPLYFHPQTNEASTAIAPADLLKFITSTGHAHAVVEF